MRECPQVAANQGSISGSWNKINVLWRQKFGELRLINYCGEKFQTIDVFSDCGTLFVCFGKHNNLHLHQQVIWSRNMVSDVISSWFIGTVCWFSSEQWTCFQRKRESSASGTDQWACKPRAKSWSFSMNLHLYTNKELVNLAGELVIPWSGDCYKQDTNTSVPHPCVLSSSFCIFSWKLLLLASALSNPLQYAMSFLTPVSLYSTTSFECWRLTLLCIKTFFSSSSAKQNSFVIHLVNYRCRLQNISTSIVACSFLSGSQTTKHTCHLWQTSALLIPQTWRACVHCHIWI